MARYIDADKLLEEVKRGGHALSEWSTLGVCAVIERQPTADVVPKSEGERLEKEIKALLAFKDYFSDLYGHGLEVANWHENGELEYFDMFYESAVDEYEAELKKKYTEGGNEKS